MGRSGRPGRALAVVAVAAALAGAAGASAALAPPAHALGDPDAAALGFEVEAGYGSGAHSAWVPLEVTLHPSRLVAGVLAVDVRTEGGPVREERPVEVSAASRKVFRFLAPAGAVSVTLHESGRQPLSVNVRRGGDDGRFLVGVLGEARADAPGVRHDAVDMTGQWVSVDPGWAELSPYALQPLGTLVAGLDELVELSPQGQRNVAAAVVSGTDLVVVADDVGAVDLGSGGLPWNPAASAVDAGDHLVLEPAEGAGVVRLSEVPAGSGEDTAGGADDIVAVTQTAGHGRVTVVGAAPGDPGLGRSSELWSELVGPGPRTQAAGAAQAVDQHPFQAARLVQEPGAGVPMLPWLAGFIVAYVVIAGPVNGIVLARLRRRELAWITIPAVTLIFTAGAFVGAVGGKSPTHLAGSLAYWVDGAASEAVVVNVRAPRPSQHRVELLDAGWTARTLRSGADPSVIRAGEGLTVDMQLEALQPGIVLGWRAVDRAAPMEVRAHATAAGLEVSVRNTTGRPLEHVRIAAATTNIPLGTLASGEERTVEVADQRLRALDPWVDPFHDLPAGPDGVPEAPRSLEALLRREIVDGNPGLVWALAVGGDAAAEMVRVDGRVPVDKGSLVAVGAAPTVGAELGAPRHAVARDLLAVRGDGMRGQLSIEGAREAILRFRLPAGERDVRLAADLSGREFGQVTLEVWSESQREWLALDQAFDENGRAEPSVLLTPLGELYVRASGELWPFEYSTRSVFEDAGAVAGSQEQA
ncbi:MAG TPA: hypothetical protein VML96_08000 [Egibacteraceae bacterium]|nr:hypothetical protein [Egibacteraceae bacterium]